MWWCLCYVNDISPRWGFVISGLCTVGGAHRYYISPRWGWVVLRFCTVGDAHRYDIIPRWGCSVRH